MMAQLLLLPLFVLSARVCYLSAEFKTLNPRYGDGGFRKSDPVTRFHAFKGQWQTSAFLAKNRLTA
jgi:hypothetical protein